MSVVCCQVEVPISGLSLQRRPNKRGASEYDREASITKMPWPIRGLLRHGGGRIHRAEPTSRVSRPNEMFSFLGALGKLQNACAVLYCHVACPALPHFSIFSHKRHDFRKKKVVKF